MKKNEAITAAEAESLKSQTVMAVVQEGPRADDYAERDEDGESYGYCPLDAVPILYKHGTVVVQIHPGEPAWDHNNLPDSMLGTVTDPETGEVSPLEDEDYGPMPGPLTVKERAATPGVVVFEIYCEDGYSIATVNDRADARQFAASPDLLASLKELRDNLTAHARLGLASSEVAMLKRADSAIAKAEGRAE